MIEKFKPTWLIEAIYQLTPEMLRKQKIKAVLADLDNTLIAWDNPNGTRELRNWLTIMKEDEISVLVVSNNTEKRVAKAVASLDIDFVSRSFKPFSRGLRLAQQKLNLDAKNMVMVGDQLLTDILAANCYGIRSILVRQLVESDALLTKFNRTFERRILRKLTRKYDMSYQKGI